MGLEFEIRNIRKFDDDLKLICACYAARAESMENIQICAPRLLLRSPANCGTLTSAPGTAKKYFADYRDVSAWSGAEQGDLQPPEADVNALAAALIHVWSAAVVYWCTMHRKSCHKCPPKWNYVRSI